MVIMDYVHKLEKCTIMKVYQTFIKIFKKKLETDTMFNLDTKIRNLEVIEEKLKNATI